MMPTAAPFRLGLTFLIAALQLGCIGGVIGGGAGGGGTGGGTGGDAQATSAVLSWEAPTASADGTPLTDLVGYRIKRGTAVGGPYTASVLDVGNVGTYTVRDLPPGTHYFVVTAVDASNNESSASNEVFKTIP